MAEKLSEIFERFAREEFHGSSPLYAALSRGVAQSVLCIMRIFSQMPRPSSERLQALSAEFGARHDLVMITARPHGGDASELVLTTFINGRRDERGLAFMQNHGDWIEWLNPQ